MLFYWLFSLSANLTITLPSTLVVCNLYTTDHDTNTVNRERFAGLNFRSFPEYHESFSVNISASLYLY